MQATLARLLALLPQPDASITTGSLDFKSHIVSRGKAQTVTGQLALTDFTGQFGTLRFKNYGTALGFDVGMKDNLLEIRKATGELREGQKAGGRFEASGSFETVKKSGSIAVKLTDFNPNGLRPFLESALGDKKLVSVSLNTTAAVNLAANGDAALKTDLSVTNLVVNDPSGTIPATPLEARVQLDATVAKQVTQIRQGQLTLTPTDRAKNELNLTGNVDASKSNAITGTLKLAAESLDVTRYYDLFAGKPKPATSAAATKPAPAPVTAPVNPDQEPPAMPLPFQNFTFELNIGRFFLRQVAISNLLTTLRIDGGHVVLKPCSLTLNSAPVSATMDLDLGVPGYKYDVAFSANAIQLAPLVNSFMPDRQGQMAGTTTASAQLKGAGITGANLQKNLTGQFDFAATNLNLAVANVRSPLLKTVINVIFSIPDLIKNPTATLGNLVGGLVGNSPVKGSWSDALANSPIDLILARGNAGGAEDQLQQAEVRGEGSH
ncbi:MAG: AsmA family protein, partial [Verrucomicrobiota bacterium]